MRTLLTASTTALAVAASLTAAAAAPVTFTSAGNNFQSFTAPETGTYDIVAFGAQGGSVFFSLTQTNFAGGLGAEIGGDFILTAGETLSIAVGTMGSPSGGGGGGTFVVGPGSSPLVIAGGGGAGLDTYISGLGADPLTKAGQTGTAGADGYSNPGGINGNGGGSYGGAGGGGGGFYSAGATIPFFGGNGGAGYPSLLGGIGIPHYLTFGDGGFGGGGGGSNAPLYNAASGGGGGYSGGGGGVIYSGGGGSFDAGANQVLVAGFNSGDGSVVITELSATPVPEPASLALLGVGVAGLLSVRRRRAS